MSNVFDFDKYQSERKCVEVVRIVEIIRPLLRGQGPEIQGAVLAELLGSWMAGWAPHLRAEVLDFHLEAVRGLTIENEKHMFGDAGHPGAVTNEKETHEK